VAMGHTWKKESACVPVRPCAAATTTRSSKEDGCAF
jgi:hypothetical protein